jgi:hypothetical protein
MKRKNVIMKSHLKKGSIIQVVHTPLFDTTFYKVTKLNERDFECENIADCGKDYVETQKFYYNIPMRIFNVVASNLEVDAVA